MNTAISRNEITNVFTLFMCHLNGTINSAVCSFILLLVVQKKNVPDEFCPKLIAGKSVISSEGESKLRSRDFLCCLKREQTGKATAKESKN